MCVVASHVPPAGDWDRNPDRVVPWPGIKSETLCSQARTQPLSHTSQGSGTNFNKKFSGMNNYKASENNDLIALWPHIIPYISH